MFYSGQDNIGNEFIQCIDNQILGRGMPGSNNRSGHQAVSSSKIQCSMVHILLIHLSSRGTGGIYGKMMYRRK